MEKHIIQYDNKNWTRYPNAKTRSDRVYFRHGKKRLHVYVWEKSNGKVPEGFHIHHKDQDTNNNELDNLECIEAKKHSKLHVELFCFGRTEKGKIHINEIRPLTKEWHGSKEGIDWHRNHALKYWWSNAKVNKGKCKVCGKKFQTLKKSNFKFCSNNCKSKDRRDKKKDHIFSNCLLCGKQFSHDKYHPRKYCNKICSKRGYWKGLKLHE